MSDARPPPGTPLCPLAAIADPGAKGFAFDNPADPERPFRGVVVRLRGEVIGFVDACPHTGAPLATEPDRYLTRTASHLMCFNHGALFRVDDGVCVAGPCVKRALRPWAVEVREGCVVAG